MLVMEHEFAGQMFRHVQKWHSACAVGAVGPWPSGRMERTLHLPAPAQLTI
jgi:hypothetical protein